MNNPQEIIEQLVELKKHWRTDPEGEVDDQIQEAVDALKAQWWISVDDRLPERDTEFLGWCHEDGTVDHWRISNDGTIWNQNSSNINQASALWKAVSHWMPLPAPPQG